MLGDSRNSVLATPTTASGGGGGGGGGGGSEVVIPPVTSTGAHQHEGGSSEAEGDRSFGGNRWPRQETLALLRIRSEMDVAFRDASAKGPLWEEVSRKLKELGYNRSAKKCKEKFENVYKYHKRTKEGRSGKQEGKTYRFFDQLEAFDQTHQHHHHHPSALPPPKPETPLALVSNPTVNAMPAVVNPTPVSSSTTVGASVSHPNITSTTVPSSINLSTTAVPSLPMPHPPTILNPTPPPPPPPNPTNTNIPSSNFPSFSPDLISNSTSSSTSSDIELQGQAKRKRKWKDFFERLMKEVVHKQEEMQKRFLETIERREQERMAREESWRMQEMTRITREREILAQERSIAAAKDAAVMAFLQKLSEQQNPAAPPPPAVHNNNNNNQNNNNNPPPAQPPQPAAAQPPMQQPPPPPPPVAQLSMTTTTTLQPRPVHMEIVKADNINGDQSFNMPASSSRWPKVEVQALISLRTELDSKYQDSGPKGPLWEEISAGMRKLGYNRNAKRCKEKWENINKYFKKVKESNKKRPEDSKTCPYFHQLDALYKEKNKSILDASSSSSALFKAENSVPLMVRPEQQWPPPPHDHQLQLDKNNVNNNRPHHDTVMEDVESEDHQNHHDEDDDKDMEEDEEEEEDEASGYEIVANNNKPSSMSAS